MENRETDNNSTFSPQQIGELTAIYDNYLYFVRQFERMLASREMLAFYQFENLFPDKDYSFPWKLNLLSYYEAKNFDDFLDEKIHSKGGRAYISLQHTNPADDKSKPLTFVPRDYTVTLMDMPLPSPIERYVIVSPEDAKIGDTEFYIDGFFKATYTRQNKKDLTVFECLNDQNVRTEFRILINMVDNMRKHNFSEFNKDVRKASDIYASETTAAYEKDILEIIGSFAEKLQSICRQNYKIQGGKEALEAAQKDGLIDSAEDYRDYVNIRNLIRHQWDTMDELGYFNTAKADKNSAKRVERLQSYLKLCDKSLTQRMKSYIATMRQMRQLICKLNPERFVREESESHNHFTKRIKKFYQENPEKTLVVELNYPLDSDKYKSLIRNLHKIIPQIKVVDDFLTQQSKLSEFEQDYHLRTWYLQTYHALECMMMNYCLTRGQDLDNHGAWRYIKDEGIISGEERNKWKRYSDLRNALSHNCLSEDLRQQMHEVEEQFCADLDVLGDKLHNLAPDVEWIEKGVYEYSHSDGMVVRLDSIKREITINKNSAVKPELKIQGKIDLAAKAKTTAAPSEPQKETYANGFEYSLHDGKITEIKFPSGIKINTEKQRIIWDTGISLHTNAENFNVLQTANCKLLTDKELNVTEFTERNRRQPFRGGDMLLMDRRHRVYIDTCGRLKDFKFKKADGNMLPTEFKRIKSGGATITFADGTRILLQNKEMVIMHGDKVLNSDNRQEFAASYNGTSTISPQIIKGGNGR